MNHFDEAPGSEQLQLLGLMYHLDLLVLTQYSLTSTIYWLLVNKHSRVNYLVT